MNDEQLKVIYDIQDLLGISYQEAYKIVDEYIYYGDVDLSDFEDDTTINTLTPIHKNIILNIMNNVQTVPLLHTNDKEVSLNIKDNQENISYLKPRDKEVLLHLMNNQENISQLNARDKEVLLHLMKNQEHISKLTTQEKEVELSLVNNKIKPLTTKSSDIDLGISGSNDNVQFLNTLDKEVSIEIQLNDVNKPSNIDLEDIVPLTINSISSIHEYEPSVNSLDILSLNNVRTIKEIELEELKQLSLNDIRNIPDIKLSDMEILSLNDIRDVPSINLIESISQLGEPLPNTRLSQLSIPDVPSVPDISDLPHIEVLSINKLDNFKIGRINARVNSNDLPLLSINNIREVPTVEHSDIEQLVLYDVPQLSDFNVSKLEELTFEQLHLDDSLDVLNEITKREVLPPVTKEDFIKAGADPDTVDMYFNDYLSTSESYNLETMRLFFKHALTEKDRAIEVGGNYKGLYKIVTEERGTFLPFITEFYMTNLCQYDEDVGTVIIRYHSMLDGFLINEANYYNSLI